MVVAALTVQRNLAVTHQGEAAVGIPHSASGSSKARTTCSLVLSVILVTLAAISATFTAWAAVIDAQHRDSAGTSARRNPTTDQRRTDNRPTAPRTRRRLRGNPAGLLLYQLAGGHLSEAIPPLLWLLAVIPGNTDRRRRRDRDPRPDRRTAPGRRGAPSRIGAGRRRRANHEEPAFASSPTFLAPEAIRTACRQSRNPRARRPIGLPRRQLAALLSRQSRADAPPPCFPPTAGRTRLFPASRG